MREKKRLFLFCIFEKKVEILFRQNVKNKVNSSSPSDPVRGATDELPECYILGLYGVTINILAFVHLFQDCVVSPSEKTPFTVIILVTTLCLCAKR